MPIRYWLLAAGLLSSAPGQTAFQTLPLNQNSSLKPEIIPGQVVVKLKASQAQTLGPAAAQSAAQSGLDHLLQRHSLKLKRGLRKATIQAQSGFGPATLAQTTGLERVYLLETGAQSVTAALAQLKQDPQVEYAEPNYRLKSQWTPNDPYWSSQGSWGQSFDDLWGLKITEAATAWDLNRGAGVLVAVIDSGVYAHPDLQANLWTNSGEIAGNGIDDDNNGYIDDVNGWNFVDNNNDTSDQNGHGTHVAGTIAAVGNNGLGVIGVAPSARILPLKGLNAEGQGGSFGLYQAMIYAADNGAKVINNSWGGFGYSYLGLDASSYATNKGVVVVVAAGNSSMDASQFNPANLPEVITVAASGPNDLPALSNGNTFSNTGTKIDIAAPGQEILSLLSPGSRIATERPDLVVGGQYLQLNGTSMASPHVAGAAALILSRFPTYSPEQVRWVLRDSADRVNPWDLNYGYGRLNLRRALQTTNPPRLTSRLALEHNLSVSGKSLVVRGTAAGTDFSQYSLAIAEYKLTLPNPFSQLTNPLTTAVTNGTLATLDLSSYSGEKTYMLRLRTQSSDGRYLDTYANISIETSQKTNWPVNNGDWEVNALQRTPAIVDLDGNGQKEVVSSSDHQLLVVNADGSTRAGFPVSLAGSAQGNPVIADFNADGKLDIALLLDVPANQPPIYVYNHQGQLLSGFPAGAIAGKTAGHTLNRNQPLAAADMNNDGLPDLVASYFNMDMDEFGAVSNFSQSLQVVNHKGQRLTGWPLQLSSVMAFDSGSFVVADLNQDGSNEILVNTPLSESSSVLDLYSSNAVLQQRKTLTGLNLARHLQIADLNADNLLDIVFEGFISNGIQQFALNRNFQTLPGWPKSINGSLGTSQLLDVNADGVLEVTYLEDNLFHAYNASGQSLPGFPLSLPVNSFNDSYAGHSAFHVAQWANQNVLFYGGGSYLMAVNLATGQNLPGWPKFSPFAMNMGIAFGDLEANGKLDIISQTYRPQLFAWEDSQLQTNPKFSLRNLNLARTNSKTATLQKAYANLFIRGTFNNWGSTAMTLVADRTWQADVVFGAASTERFKFDVHGNWTLNFGENQNGGRNASGTAEQSGGDIYPTEGAGTYRVIFNDQTLAFSLRKLGTAPNQAPIARTNGDQSIQGAGQVTLNGSTSSDADGTILSYQWAQTSGPLSGVAIANPTQAQTFVQLPAYSGSNPVVRVFRLTVTDNGGLSSFADMTITQTGSSGFSKLYNQVYLRGTGNSWGLTAMTLVANNTWEGSQVFGAASTERFKFDINGDWSLNFGENDNAGRNTSGTAEQSGGDIFPTQGAGTYVIRFNDQTKAFSVTKSGVNQAPISRPGVDQTVSGAALVSLNGSASSDPDGNIVSYQWLQVGGPTVSIQNATSATASVQLPAFSGTPTTFRFRLTVTDNGGLTNSAETVVQQIGGSFSKLYNQVYLRGTSNNWTTSSMNLIDNNLWEITATFGATSTERFKFDINADWSLNFGDSNADGTAEQNGTDIKVLQGAGNYRIRFNDQTKLYSLIKL